MSESQPTFPFATSRWHRGFATTALAAFLLLGSSPLFSAVAAAVGSGSIAGTVSDATTGNLLEGAKVELPALGRSTFVDHTGRYVLDAVPAGSHELIASYTGLESRKLAVTVAAGQRATRDFDLTSGVHVLDVFKVAGEKEGNAAAITQQRNADNLKNVASMDAYGNLPNLNATELALRLPGVTFGNPGDEVVEVVSVRGMGPGMTVITIDGGLMSSLGAQNRNTRMTAFTGAMFESLEVIKGHTPDTGADSLGGSINFKTRSPLTMREKRRIGYTLSTSFVPTFTEQVPLREKHRAHPLLNVTYQEKFAPFGRGEENLAVAVNLFYSENAFGFFRTTRDYQQTRNIPAYLWDYRTTDNYNNRMQRSLTTKFDYRLSPNSLLKLNLIYNDAPEPMRRQYTTRAFAGSGTTTPNATTTGVVPGAFTERITVVRAVPTPTSATSSTTPAAAIDVTSTLINRDQRLRHLDFAGEHTVGSFSLDWAVVWSRTRYRTLGNEGVLINRIGGIPFTGPNGLPGTSTNNLRGPNGQTGVGWILDRTQSDLYPRFIQNGGLDFTDPRNYRPRTTDGLSSNAGDLNQHLARDVRGNVKYPLPFTSFSAFFKTGFDLREQTVSNTQNHRRWNYIGKDALPTDPTILLWDKVKTGRAIPVWDAAAFIQNGQPIDPSLWQENRYFFEQTKYTGTNETKETVTAGYVMAQGRFGRNGFLGGVRGETTETASYVYVRNRVATTAAQQLADPVGSARIDYADNLRRNVGTYTKYFPSVHLWRNLTPNLKARLSWSTSFGRPSMAAYLPTATVNETANPPSLTIGNPNLKPQTAKNWDATLEYYFEPSGSLSAGWFHKTIDDFIVNTVNLGVVPTGLDNGYNGQYAGLTQFATVNLGTAIAEGWEFSYLQQFRFLPGFLKGLSLNANLSLMSSHGNFAGIGYLTNSQIVSFIPRTSNVSLSWNYRKFGTRLLYNYTSENIRTVYNPVTPSLNQYMRAREMVNLGLTYRLRSNVTLQVDIANLFNEPQAYFQGIRDHLDTFLIQGTKITAGLQGQF